MSRARLSVAPAPLPARPLITADALATMLASGGISGGIPPRSQPPRRLDAAWLAQGAVDRGARVAPLQPCG